MELLILLAASEGRLVSRAEIAETLWGSEVFVDTEHGINTAVRKVRQVLRDDSEEPRFVQTVTGKGYRFIGDVTCTGAALEAAEATPGPGETVASGATLAAPLSSEATAAPSASPAEPGTRWWKRWRTTGPLAMATVLLIAGVLFGAGVGHRGFFRSSLSPPMHTIAVLPLDNLSGEPGQDYLADGMTDELITMLAKSSTLRVVSRTSILQFKGVHRPLTEIARQLGADGILEGSFTRAGDAVRLRLQLIDARTDTHIWAESYDRGINDLVTLPGTAATAIAARLQSEASTTAANRFVRPEAHDAYLRGLYLWFSGNNDTAGEYFRKATELQPDYALGWSGLADFYIAGAIEGDLDPQQSLGAGYEAARKAVSLDPLLAQAHLALAASIFTYRWDWNGAEQEIQRAIELDPKFAEAYHLHAKMLGALHRDDEAIAAQRTATEIDPFSRPWAMTLALMQARRFDAALEEAKRRLESNPTDPLLHALAFEIYRCLGKPQQAVEELEQYESLGGGAAAPGEVRQAYAQGGFPAVVRWRLNYLRARARTRYVSPVGPAAYTAELGRRQETLALLEEAYRQHSPNLLWIQNEPAFDFLHADPRYRALIDRIGLPPAY